MIYTSEDNWYTWRYGSGLSRGRQTDEMLPLSTNYRRYNGIVEDFNTELKKAASSTLDHYPGLKPCIFFSGGVDSELILRTYLAIGADPIVYIVRYENDYNIYDVSYAVVVCSTLNVKYHIIDFNLEKFYENDSLTVAEQAQIDRPRMLPHLKFTDVCDGLIIVGHSDVRWYRPHNDYSKRATWIAQDFEHDLGCDKYNMLHNRPAIYQWWKWTPGLLLSYTELEWFKQLVNDRIYGKLGINSTKIHGFREVYPDLIERIKYTGFELTDHLVHKTENRFIEHFKKLPYRNYIERSIDEFWLEIRGTNYPYTFIS